MTNPLFVTPDQLRATSDHLAEVGNRMWGVLNKLELNLGGEGGPWGDDKIGNQFADGGSGYIAQKDWVDGSINAKKDLLHEYSTGLRTAANTLEQQDNG